MKKIGILFVTIIMAVLFAVSANAATEGYYTYYVSDGEATITDVDESISGDVTIPSTLGGYPVTSIVNYAFNYCNNLTSITIPEGVTSIGNYAFYYCKSLTSITVDTNNKYYSSDSNGVLFDKNKTELIQYPAGNTSSSYVIPDGVTSIGSSAFYNCKSLTSITLPDSVTSIDYSAFYNCKSLTSITIPESVTSIGSSVFRGCTSLASITLPFVGETLDGTNNTQFGHIFGGSSYIPESLKEVIITAPCNTIGNYAFHYCESLTSITIPDSVTSIGSYAFYACRSLTSISIPEGVTSIGDGAFFYCTNLTSITTPDSVTSIGEEAFYYCESLTSITIDTNNKYYSSDGDGVLFNKNKTELIQYPAGNTSSSYVIPDSVTSIGDFAFFRCTSLTSITITEGVTSIGSYAFYDCKSLTSITIPDSVASIGDGAFAWCKSLTSITIPECVTSIGEEAFYCCESLTSITIPDSVTSIGEEAFYFCESLTSITIPDSVTSIGDFAFCGCYRLKDVYYLGSQSQWKKISIGSYNNDDLLSANIHYNYNPHTHSYTAQITKEPTHLAEGVMTFTCACGDSYTEAIAKLAEHTYDVTITTPTCTEQGYTTYTCECGYSYKADYVDANGHSFTNYISDGTATCVTDGKLIAKCDNCNATDSKPEKGTHKFSDEFITDVEATCTDRGHKIYTCDCGANYSDTIPAKGHSFNGSACTDCGYDKADTCSCNCHKSGISAIIWNIINFFNKLLRKNNICACGAAHY